LGIAALIGGLAVAAQPMSANDAAATKHVLLISVDGLHQTDLATPRSAPWSKRSSTGTSTAAR
jgi:hypothetical protein